MVPPQPLVLARRTWHWGIRGGPNQAQRPSGLYQPSSTKADRVDAMVSPIDDSDDSIGTRALDSDGRLAIARRADGGGAGATNIARVGELECALGHLVATGREMMESRGVRAPARVRESESRRTARAVAL